MSTTALSGESQSNGGSAGHAQRDEIRFPKGTTIFRQGDPGHEMFVIAEGKVRLTLGSGAYEKEIAVFGTGDFFGELSLLSGAARSATAEAAEDTVLLPISRDVFGMMIQDDLEIVFRMLDAQGNRLRQTNRPIEELLHRLGRVRVVSGCVGRMWPDAVKGSAVCTAADLAAELDIEVSEIVEVFGDLARAGAGELQNGSLRVTGETQFSSLIDALRDYTKRES